MTVSTLPSELLILLQPVHHEAELSSEKGWIAIVQGQGHSRGSNVQ